MTLREILPIIVFGPQLLSLYVESENDSNYDKCISYDIVDKHDLQKRYPKYLDNEVKIVSLNHPEIYLKRKGK